MINLNSINLSQSSSNASVSPEQITNAVNNYLDNNPITFEETDPNVPEWAKQPNKPAYTAYEVGALPISTIFKTINNQSIIGEGNIQVEGTGSSITTIYGEIINHNIDSDGLVTYGQLVIRDSEGNILTQKQIQELENYQLDIEGIIMDRISYDQYCKIYSVDGSTMSLYIYEDDSDDSEDRYLYNYVGYYIVTADLFKDTYINSCINVIETEDVNDIEELTEYEKEYISQYPEDEIPPFVTLKGNGNVIGPNDIQNMVGNIYIMIDGYMCNANIIRGDGMVIIVSELQYDPDITFKVLIGFIPGFTHGIMYVSNFASLDKTLSDIEMYHYDGDFNGHIAGNTKYTLGDMSELNITSITKSDKESLVYFTAGEGFTMSIPKDTEIIGDLSVEPGKSYVMSVLNRVVVMGEITKYNE